MTFARLAIGFGLGLSVMACGSVDLPTRNAQLEPLVNVIPVIGTFPAPAVTVTGVDVVVPRSLQVFEADRFLPAGDIVWREDPDGDRHEQVRAIVADGMTRGVAGLSGPVDARLQVQVARFHALTDKARSTTGGVHSVSFDMQLVEAATGLPLTDMRRVDADLKGLGGQAAVRAMARGQTQKARITDHLAQVIRQVLLNPDAYRAARLDQLETFDDS
ncbi:DUF6778 family protein [Tritonibacter horizontis]|uniref:Lipoprotein n=1 Tax=Tritonibacter horizontis TaxID=1768241 RepID=A0A132BVH6_9RHOB|nr:DUF6778 family protein [Tritonibacter horizontis]KUP92294.1 hypothetical protein TRIHO_29360 [Tritonibacter horizontis]